MNYIYDISIILVNYNGKRYIDTLFKSLKELVLDDIRVEIIFVDNASSDDSVEYLRKNYNWDNISIIENDRNAGFAEGNNIGVKNSKGKYIVFLNNDTKVDQFWLKKLYIRITKDKNIGIINSKLLFFYDFIKIQTKTNDKFNIEKRVVINEHNYDIDNKFSKNLLLEDNLTCFGNSYFYIPLLDENRESKFILNLSNYNKETDHILVEDTVYKPDENGQIKIKYTSEEIVKIKKILIQNAGSGINKNCDGYDIGMGEEDGEKYCDEYEINNVCGASFIILKEDFIKAGMFDENFFMYYEDTDLSYRVKRLGKKIIYYPNSIVRHIHTGSSKEWSPFFVFHVVRNKALFVYKNISKLKGIIILIKNCIRRDRNVRKAGLSGFKIIIKNRHTNEFKGY